MEMRACLRMDGSRCVGRSGEGLRWIDGANQSASRKRHCCSGRSAFDDVRTKERLMKRPSKDIEVDPSSRPPVTSAIPVPSWAN